MEKKKQEITGLKDERQELKKEIDKYLKKISELEKECEKYGQTASKANANLFQVIEELKLKKNLIAELKKENIEFHAKLKQQQNLYEAVRSDRNLYSKNLIEAQDELAEFRRKFKIATHQISQLKDEIEAKDAALTKEHYELHKIKKESDNTKSHNDQLKKQNEKQKGELDNLRKDISKLNHMIKSAEDELKK